MSQRLTFLYDLSRIEQAWWPQSYGFFGAPIGGAGRSVSAAGAGNSAGALGFLSAAAGGNSGMLGGSMGGAGVPLPKSDGGNGDAAG